ncbi:MAG: VanW family protein [Patescibacteria group bacterium]
MKLGPENKIRSIKGSWLSKNWRMITVLIVVLLIIPLGYNFAYAGKIFPGVKLGSLEIGGLELQAAELKVQKTWDKLAQQGWQVKLVDGRQVNLPTKVTAPADPDLTYDLILLDVEREVDQAYSWGRTGNILGRWWLPFWAGVKGVSLSLEPQVERVRVITFLSENFSELEQAPVPADLLLDAAGNLSVTPERLGTVLNREKLFNDLTKRLVNFSNEDIILEINQQAPLLTEIKVAALLPKARHLLTDTEFTLILSKREWQLTPRVWHKWLGVREVAGEAELGLILQKAESYFNTLAEQINQPAQDAKFAIKNGRVIQFQASKVGQELKVPETLQAIEQAVIAAENRELALVVETTEPQVTTGEANDLGITEIIGVGRSNFAGSPKNRRHNIKVGIDTLNGILINPDEEFSLVKALGEIDSEAGYLPELVIKGNKTIPEYGGGLCQVGTTTFRTVLASGLPVLERRNHSYRVPYYEPAGTDATIYDPWPDFRFKNDSGSAILIQTKIEEDDLIFEFWGTKDGRTVQQTTPIISNIVAPLPTKYVDTEDLPVGEKKCTERAHNGADTEFTYTVTYPSGEKKEEVFKSHYVPWQEVCLIGVPKGTLEQNQTGETEAPSGDIQNQN